MTGQMLVKDLEPLDPLDSALHVDPHLRDFIARPIFGSRELWSALYIEWRCDEECSLVVNILFNLREALKDHTIHTHLTSMRDVALILYCNTG